MTIINLDYIKTHNLNNKCNENDDNIKNRAFNKQIKTKK